jgi:hypothetical protein
VLPSITSCVQPPAPSTRAKSDEAEQREGITIECGVSESPLEEVMTTVDGRGKKNLGLELFREGNR